MPHNSDQPGRVPPSRFEGELQQALDSGPVPPLLNHMEFEDVHLQDVMIAPFQHHQTETLYRVLGIAAASGAAADAGLRTALKRPIADMLAEFFERCASALVGGAAAALRDLGHDVVRTADSGRRVIGESGCDCNSLL